MNERAKNLATLILIGSDRITKAMRKEALELLNEIRQETEARSVTFDIGNGQDVTVSKRQLSKYRRLIDGGLWISAIKEARTDLGLGLKESKCLIDIIRDNVM